MVSPDIGTLMQKDDIVWLMGGYEMVDKLIQGGLMDGQFDNYLTMPLASREKHCFLDKKKNKKKRMKPIDYNGFSVKMFKTSMVGYQCVNFLTN